MRFKNNQELLGQINFIPGQLLAHHQPIGGDLPVTWEVLLNLMHNGRLRMPRLRQPVAICSVMMMPLAKLEQELHCLCHSALLALE